MSAPDHATLLLRIVEAGAAAVQPKMPNGERLEALTALRAAAEHKRMPVDGVFLIDAWDVLVLDALILCETARRNGEDAKATEWLQVIGMMLPKVREHLLAAMAWRRDTRPTP